MCPICAWSSHLNTLNKIEDRESYVDAENGMYMFLNNLFRTLNITEVFLWEEVRDLAVWCQDNNLSLNVIKTKKQH